MAPKPAQKGKAGAPPPEEDPAAQVRLKHGAPHAARRAGPAFWRGCMNTCLAAPWPCLTVSNMCAEGIDVYDTAVMLTAVVVCCVLFLQLPADLPAESPFTVEWNAVVNMVWVADGLNAAAIREAMGKLKVAQLLSVADLAARLDAADPLAAEVAAAEGGIDRWV